MAKAISYMRFSSLNQGRGSTIDRQQKLIDYWLQAHPEIEYSNLSVKDLGKSGYSGENVKQGLGTILAAIDAGKIVAGDYLLVEAMDRLGRLRTMEMFSLVERIVGRGVTIVTLEDNQSYSSETMDEAPIFTFVGKVQQAHNYSKQLGRRIAQAYERKRVLARQGKPIKVHNAYWLNSENRLDPDRAKIVLACIELYLKGYGTRRIILVLGEQYPALQSVYPSTLKRWFTNRALIGSWKNKGDEIANVFEPLIDLERFHALQRMMDRRKRYMSPEETYDLSGLVVCSGCGARYHFRRKRHADYVITYANCSTYLKRGPTYCENNKVWPYEVLNMVFEQSCQEALSAEFEATYRQREIGAIETLQSEIDFIGTKIKKLVDALQVVPNQREITDSIAQLTDERDSMRRKVREAERALSTYVENDGLDEEEDFEALENHWDQLESDPIHRRSILRRRGYKIEGYLDRISVLAGPAGFTECRLVKRSTKRKCYFVEISTPEYWLLEVSSDAYLYSPAQKVKLAINRDGVINSMETENWDDLFEEKVPESQRSIEEILQAAIEAGVIVEKSG